MIKLIKDSPRKWTIKCDWCGCEYSYELEDIGEDGILHKSTKCPVCAYINKHPSQNINVASQVDKFPTSINVTVKEDKMYDL